MSDRAAPLLELRNVSVVRGDNLALDRCRLSIEQGEHLCILAQRLRQIHVDQTLTPRNAIRLPAKNPRSKLGRDLWNISNCAPWLGIVSPDLLAACTTDATGLDVVLSGFFQQHPHLSQITSRSQSTGARGRRAGAACIAHLASGRWRKCHPVKPSAPDRARACAMSRRPCCLTNRQRLDIAGQVEIRETMRELARAGVGNSAGHPPRFEIIPEIERVVLLQSGRILPMEQRKKCSR